MCPDWPGPFLPSPPRCQSFRYAEVRHHDSLSLLIMNNLRWCWFPTLLVNLRLGTALNPSCWQSVTYEPNGSEPVQRQVMLDSSAVFRSLVLLTWRGKYRPFATTRQSGRNNVFSACTGPPAGPIPAKTPPRCPYRSRSWTCTSTGWGRKTVWASN